MGQDSPSILFQIFVFIDISTEEHSSHKVVDGNGWGFIICVTQFFEYLSGYMSESLL